MNKATDVIQELQRIDPYRRYGKVTRVIGLLIESRGPEASVGDLCYIHLSRSGRRLMAEVVGFKNDDLLLMPYSRVDDISSGSLIENTGRPLTIKAGTSLLGRVLNSYGQPIDGKPSVKSGFTCSTNHTPPGPMERPIIEEIMGTGVRSIDALLTVGKGQRVGIFAGSGVGKSTLLGMVAKNTTADLNVIALIGERGREVREFIDDELGPEGLKKSIVITSTSDNTPLERVKAALTATAVAEHFRDQGKDVLVMMDSLTRVAMAQREIGLAVGEPPTTKGYPPSVFALLPQILERAGTSASGSITAFYTVLVDGDDLDEPVSDAARGLLDGHIVLDRKLAETGQFPAVNVLKSISRLMNKVADGDHRQAAAVFRAMLANYKEAEDLIQIGAYKKGSSTAVDQAIAKKPIMDQFLKQNADESASFVDSVARLQEAFGKETIS